MKRLFLAAMVKGVTVIVLTRPTESFSDTSRQKVSELVNDLSNSGVRVVTKDLIHQKFAVIDRRVVWYGSINLLSYGRSEESMMRFENREIAEELLIDMEKTVI